MTTQDEEIVGQDIGQESTGQELGGQELGTGSIGRRQIAALSDLVELSNVSDRTEREIDTELQTRLAWLKRRLERTRDGAEARAGDLRRQMKISHEKKRVSLRDAAAQDAAQTSEVDAQRRAQAAAKAASAERKLRGEYDHERWVADSVLEGRLGKLKAQRAADVARDAARRERLESVQTLAGVSLRGFRKRWVAGDGQEALKGLPEGLEALEGADAEETVALDTAAQRLRRVWWAKPFEGPAPWLLGAVAVAGAAVGGVVVGETMQLGWSRVGLAGGGGVAGLVLVVGLGVVLRGPARRAAHTALDGFAAASARHAAYLDARAAAVVADRDAREAAAREQCAATHATTEQAFAPQFAKIAAFREHAAGVTQQQQNQDRQAFKAAHGGALEAFEAESQSAVAAAESRLDRRRDVAGRRHDRDVAAAQATAASGRAGLQSRWDAGRDRVLSSLDEMRRLEATSNRPWSDAAWASWEPPTTSAPAVRFGALHIDTQSLLDSSAAGGRFDLGLPPSLAVPALLSGPDQRSLYLAAQPEAREAGLELLRSVMMRLLTTLPPGRARFTLIDPVGLGESFGGFMHLADHADGLVNGRVWSEPAHIDQRLTDLTDHMGQMIQKYLRNDYASIDAYNAQAGELAEPYRFLVVADYPHGFSAQAVSRLNSIAASGARCGVFVLVLHDPRRELASAQADDLRRHCVLVTHAAVDGGAAAWRWRHPVCERFGFTPDAAPDEALMTDLVGRVGRAAVAAGRVQVPFASVTPTAEERWTGRGSEGLSVPIGRAGATRLQRFELGGGVAHHALVAGRTGSGKSSLLHVLIANLCLWYPPDQLELYLIDFKKGVEFKPYVNRRPPHLRAVAVESDREFGLSILKRLDVMLDERGEAFRAAGVANLAGYHAAEPDKAMPRVVLVVDEFQELFTQDDAVAQAAGLLLDRLVRQGRAFGMHAFLGSQSLSGAAGLPRGTIGQMSVRIALQCSDNDSQLILGDDNTAARLLERPGEGIYNDQAGKLESNSLFQVAWLPEPELDATLRTIEDLQRAAEAAGGAPAGPCFVFEGSAPADVRDSPALRQVRAAGGVPAPGSGAGPATPRAFLGEPIAIDDAASVEFPRLNGAHALVLGQDADAQLGLVMAMLLSLAATHPADRARFVVASGSTDPAHDRTVRETLDLLPHGVAHIPQRDLNGALAELHVELKRRMEEGDVNGPATFVFLLGIERFRQLRRSEEDFSFSMSEEPAPAKPDVMLGDLLRDGPTVGMHLITGCDRAASLEQVFDRRAMREFDHRVLFQMSATDSAQIIDGSDAAELGPCRALLCREDRGTVTRFRPYGALSDEAQAELVAAFRGRSGSADVPSGRVTE